MVSQSLRQLALFGLVMALVGSPGCDPSSDVRNESDPPPAAPRTVDRTSVSKVVGAEGGTLEHPTGAKVVIPAGALSGSTTVTMTGIDAPPASVLGGPALGQGFQMEPDGLSFAKVVSVVIPFDATLLPPGADLAHVQVLTAPAGSTEFAALETTGSLAEGKLEAKAVHFSQFVPAENANPVFVKTKTLPNATVGAAYAASLEATGGTPPYTWSVGVGGVGLPAGLVLGANGAISGTPSQPAAGAFNVVVKDSGTNVVQRALALTVESALAPAPTLTSITPTSVNQGSDATTLTLLGTSFVPSSFATWNGARLETSFVGATQLSALVPKALLASPGVFDIGVTTPAPGGGTSDALALTVSAVPQNPKPVLVSISPQTGNAGDVDTVITVTGSSFIESSKVVVNDTQELSTSYESSTELEAIIPSTLLASARSVRIRVNTPAPGGGLSDATVLFTVVGPQNAVPTISQLAPAQATAGSAPVALTVSGTGFVTGAQIFFDGTALATTVGSATTATATIASNLLTTAGTYDVTINNPSPGGGPSAASTFTVVAAAAPTLASITPNQVTAGASDTVLTLVGTGFVAGASSFDFGGAAFAMNVLGPTSATVTIPASSLDVARAVSVQVTSASGNSGTLAFTIAAENPAPVIWSISPTNVRVGSAALTLAVNSQSDRFLPGAQVFVDGALVPTSWINGYTLYAQVPANVLAATGTRQITAKNPDSAVSAATALTVGTGGNVSPGLSSLSPDTATFATTSAVTVTLTGSVFVVNGSTVYWRAPGDAVPLPVGLVGRATAVVNSTSTITLTLQPGGILDTAGTHYVSVGTRASGGQSPEVAFTVTGTNPVPTIDHLAPAELGVGTGDVPITLFSPKPNSNFVARTAVSASVNGADARLLGYCGQHGPECTVTLPKSLLSQAGNVSIQATSPGAGPGNSLGIGVVAGNPTPVLARDNPIVPATLTQNDPSQSVTVNGTGFMAGTTVRELQTNTTIAVTAFTATTLRFTVPASLLDGSRSFLQFAIANPAPGGGSALTPSAQVVLGPVITSAPASVPVNTAIDITGLNLDLGPSLTLVCPAGEAPPQLATARTATTASFPGIAQARGYGCRVEIPGYPSSGSFELQVTP